MTHCGLRPALWVIFLMCRLCGCPEELEGGGHAASSEVLWCPTVPRPSPAPSWVRKGPGAPTQALAAHICQEPKHRSLNRSLEEAGEGQGTLCLWGPARLAQLLALCQALGNPSQACQLGMLTLQTKR